MEVVKIISSNSNEFQKLLFKKLQLQYCDSDFPKIYRNKSYGSLLKYFRKDCYEFSIGDYTICDNFKISFNHNEELLKFGTVFTGTTNFNIENTEVTSFSPSSFLVFEKNLKGVQVWKKDQHFHGAEIIISKKYFDDYINSFFPGCFDFNHFIPNYTYNYLPQSILEILRNLQNLSEENKLTPLYLEAKILECLSILNSELSSAENTFTTQVNYGKIKIGKNRYINLSASDIKAITKAHEILSEEFVYPPSIEELSRRVFINSQKLKAGFLFKYHLTPGQFVLSLKMDKAKNLLFTTELTIEEISKETGYSYSSNFVKAFKKVYKKSPLAFRKNKNINSTEINSSKI